MRNIVTSHINPRSLIVTAMFFFVLLVSFALRSRVQQPLLHPLLCAALPCLMLLGLCAAARQKDLSSTAALMLSCMLLALMLRGTASVRPVMVTGVVVLALAALVFDYRKYTRMRRSTLDWLGAAYCLMIMAFAAAEIVP